jgi:hypothetical protein
VALIFSDTSKPQGRGFEPLLRLFLSYVAGASFLSMSSDVSGMVIEWWWKVRIFFFLLRGGSWDLVDRVGVGLDVCEPNPFTWMVGWLPCDFLFSMLDLVESQLSTGEVVLRRI